MFWSKKAICEHIWKEYDIEGATIKGCPWICSECGVEGFEEKNHRYKSTMARFGKKHEHTS
jgi:hypothetical protein